MLGTIFGLATISAAVLGVVRAASTPAVNAIPALGFFNSSVNGGAWLTNAANTYPAGLGEPINVVVSANSDPLILTSEGFLDFMISVEMAGECLGQHVGSDQSANLGDGNGELNQTSVLRYDYGNPAIGTCQESILGGNHLRYWIQNGSLANSGAIFMAVSVEQNISQGHNILTPDGYAAGRKWLTGNATAPLTTSVNTNRTFKTTSQSLNGYLPANSSQGINHGLVYDGVVDVWTVRIVSNGSATTSSRSTANTNVGNRSWTVLGAIAISLLLEGVLEVL